MYNKKVPHVMNYLRTSKAVHKNNPQTYSPKQIKKPY